MQHFFPLDESTKVFRSLEDYLEEIIVQFRQTKYIQHFSAEEILDELREKISTQCRKILRAPSLASVCSRTITSGRRMFLYLPQNWRAL